MTDVRLRNLLAMSLDVVLFVVLALWIHLVYWMIAHDVFEFGDAREGVPVLSPLEDVRRADPVPR